MLSTDLAREDNKSTLDSCHFDLSYSEGVGVRHVNFTSKIYGINVTLNGDQTFGVLFAQQTPIMGLKSDHEIILIMLVSLES